MNCKLTVAVALVSGLAYGNSANFPDADGSHDVSSEAAWGGTLPSSKSWSSAFTSATGGGGTVPYNANTGDVTFYGFEIASGSHRFDFPPAETRTFTVGNNGVYLLATGSTNVITGGKWKFNAGRFVLASGNVDTTDLHSSLTFVSADILTPTVKVGFGSTSHSEIVVSNTVLQATQLTVSETAAAGFNRFVLTGESTAFQQKGSAALFGAGHDSEIVVADRAVFTNADADLILGAAAPGHNVLRIADGASLVGPRQIKTTIGDSELPNDAIEVLNGGSLTAENLLLERTDLLVSNGTVKCTVVRPNLGGTSNVVTFAGADAVLDFAGTTAWPLFGGQGGVIAVRDGATLSYEKPIYSSWGSGKKDNVLRICRNGHFSSTSTTGLQFGYLSADSGNRLEVVDNGTLEAYKVAVGSVGQTVLVSNATFAVTDSVRLGYSSSGVSSSGCRFEIAGATASVTVPTFQTDGDSVLHFALPESGYAGVPLCITTSFIAAETARITVDAEAYQRTLTKKTDVVLATLAFSATKYRTAFAALLEASNAQLAEKRLSLSSVDDQLVLTVLPPKRGLLLILR